MVSVNNHEMIIFRFLIFSSDKKPKKRIFTLFT